jgi:hypothetical protein
MDRIAREYNTGLWHEGRGWGKTADEANAYPPVFLEHYAREGHDRETAKGLAEKLAWARRQIESGQLKLGPRPFYGFTGPPDYGFINAGPLALMNLWPKEAKLARGRELVSYQREDGSIPYDPEGRHKTNFYLFCDSIYKPLGNKGDTALGLSVEPAMELLLLADSTGEQQFRAAARKALDYCLTMQRPEGGDWWETPLHSPNLLAAGHAAIAYYLGYKTFNDPRYLQKAIYWVRSILPFTHLWQPEEVAEIYNTKPCLNTTAWYVSNWVINHVQWEVLESFAMSSELGIDWGKIDPGIDWHRFQKGITVAVLRWMIDHNDPTHKWDPDWGVADADPAKRGLLDTCFADAHDSVTGRYWGGLIEPEPVGINLTAILERE